jgi:hypothetical protein
MNGTITIDQSHRLCGGLERLSGGLIFDRITLEDLHNFMLGVMRERLKQWCMMTDDVAGNTDIRINMHSIFSL